MAISGSPRNYQRGRRRGWKVRACPHFWGTSFNFPSLSTLRSLTLETSQSFQVSLCIFLSIMPSSGPRPIPQDLGTIASDKNKLDKQTNLQSFSSNSSKKTTKPQGTDWQGPESKTSRDPKVLVASVWILPVAQSCQLIGPRSTHARTVAEGKFIDTGQATALAQAVLGWHCLSVKT